MEPEDERLPLRDAAVEGGEDGLEGGEGLPQVGRLARQEPVRLARGEGLEQPRDG